MQKKTSDKAGAQPHLGGAAGGMACAEGYVLSRFFNEVDTRLEKSSYRAIQSLLSPPNTLLPVMNAAWPDS